jgi:hypothetical protein
MGVFKGLGGWKFPRGVEVRHCNAVMELLAIVRSLIHENQAPREAASPGFARRRPIVFGKSS